MPQKKKLIIIIVVTIVITGGIVAALAMGGGKNDQPTKDNTGNSKNETTKQNALLGEMFTNQQTGTSMGVPKGWQLAPKSDNPGSLTKLQHSQSRANGELITITSNVDMDSVVRSYLEGGLNVDATTTLVSNKTITSGGNTGRELIQDIPGPNGQTGRVAQYIFSKDGKYYILTYTVLTTDWEALKPGIEASVASLKLK